MAEKSKRATFDTTAEAGESKGVFCQIKEFLILVFATFPSDTCDFCTARNLEFSDLGNRVRVRVRVRVSSRMTVSSRNSTDNEMKENSIFNEIKKTCDFNE